MQTVLWVIAGEVALVIVLILGIAGAVVWALNILGQPETFRLPRD